MTNRHGDVTPYSEEERQRDAQAKRDALDHRYTARKRRQKRIYRERPHGVPLSQVYDGHGDAAIKASLALTRRIQGERD